MPSLRNRTVFLTSLRQWMKSFAPRPGLATARTDRHRSRLRLELLEDRCVPSTVTTLMDSGPGSLRDAIANSSPGDTIDFQSDLSGTITLTSGELLLGQDLTIAGPGADVITVSGNNASRVFEIAASATVDISGLTISAGQATGSLNGGGIENAGTLTVTDSVISGNNAPGNFAGGIDNTGALTVLTSTVSGNNAGAGAGITNRGSGPVTVADSTVSGNVSNFNGAGLLNASGGTLTVTDSVISGNTNFGGNGGGILNGTGTLFVTDTTISGNSSNSAAGGGIDNLDTATVTQSTISGNAAHSGGGGIANFGTLTLTESTLSGNTAFGGFGGGIANYSGAITIDGATVSANHTDGTGGGVMQISGQLTARNTILAGNTAGTSPDINSTLHSQGHNLIGDGTGGSGYDPTDLVGTSANPIDPLLGPLQDNGGPTQTMALLDGSPALGAGDPTNAPDWDQRGPGFPRVVNGAIDIGAFETQDNSPTSAARPLVPFRGVSFSTGSLVLPQQTGGLTAPNAIVATDTGDGNGALDLRNLSRFLPAYGNAAGDIGELASFGFQGDGQLDLTDLALSLDGRE
jgi:hypothetical protein